MRAIEGVQVAIHDEGAFVSGQPALAGHAANVVGFATAARAGPQCERHRRRMSWTGSLVATLTASSRYLRLLILHLIHYLDVTRDRTKTAGWERVSEQAPWAEPIPVRLWFVDGLIAQL